jgi:hypothetical protein
MEKKPKNNDLQNTKVLLTVLSAALMTSSIGCVVSAGVHLKTHFLWILTTKFKLFFVNYFKIAINCMY